jgi:hypothetical protein
MTRQLCVRNSEQPLFLATDYFAGCYLFFRSLLPRFPQRRTCIMGESGTAKLCL